MNGKRFITSVGYTLALWGLAASISSFLYGFFGVQWWTTTDTPGRSFIVGTWHICGYFAWIAGLCVLGIIYTSEET